MLNKTNYCTSLYALGFLRRSKSQFPFNTPYAIGIKPRKAIV